MTRKTAAEIIKVGETLFESLSRCEICPHECRVNRFQGERGKCNSGTELKVASYNLHGGEEPPLSGGGGSGTIFLANCSLFCKYCQNYPISQMGTGSFVSVDECRDMMLELQKRGADNINFVTPDHMLPMILLALGRAREAGLTLPIVYNCSGYQKLGILMLLEGIIDIYLADMRYNDDRLAKKYSGCDNYVAVNRAAVREMYRQVGNLEMDDRGLAVKGILIRHLVLPNNISGSQEIFKFLAEETSEDIYVSLMSQYFPAYKAVDDEKINRRLTVKEFDKAVDAFYDAGLGNGFIQHLSYESIY
jgi:putative pyruvate formate lyase activating enzyme